MSGGAWRTQTLAAALALIGTLVAAPAHADVVRLAPSQDTTIYSESGDLSNGAGEFAFAGRTGVAGSRRALLAFDVAGNVPAGSTITSVTLTVHVSQSPGAFSPASVPERFVLHRLTEAWGEGASDASHPGGIGAPAAANDATWTHRFWNATAWALPGGDFAASASGSLIIPVTNDGLFSWSSTPAMVADVQDWLDTPARNFGWIVVGNEAAAKTARRFDSRENRTPANRPVLTIEFDPPAKRPSR
jgi:hypothetical protein